MNLQVKKPVIALALLFSAVSVFAASDIQLCSELSGYFSSNQEPKLPNPTRDPTQAERTLIDKSKIELLESTDYAAGVSIVDADNDGKDDVFVWGIQGSGRFVYAELYDAPSQQVGHAGVLARKASLELGVLHEPRFVRFKSVNYLVSTDGANDEGINVVRLTKTAGRYQQQTVCRMQITVKSDASCRHPACKTLRDVIDNTTENGPFVNVEWPYTQFPPAGLEVYFSRDSSEGDFDNTGKPTSIWRFGRDGDINQNIGWTLLGEGDVMPNVEAKLLPLSEDATKRRVLPGDKNARLRKTLAQQSEALSVQLQRPIAVPNEGEFFLFKANGNKTYWAWDFGGPPLGEEIHVTYTNATKSDYVGVVRIKRNRVLVPCVSGCVISLDQ